MGNHSDRSGGIILLGDGTQVLTDDDDNYMFDHGDEDRDLESQVSKAWPMEIDGDKDETHEIQTEREETPAPQTPSRAGKPQTPESLQDGNPFDTPSSTASEKSEDNNDTATASTKVIPEGALPTKLYSPSKGKEEESNHARAI